eukprot:PhM_4_TR3534/c0_g1_i1/m.48789
MFSFSSSRLCCSSRSVSSSHSSPASNILADTFGRAHTYLRISLTEKCNLRCVYCMPEKGVELTPSDKLLTRDEITRLVNIFARHGVRKVRLTGGEPLVRRDVVDIARGIRSVPGIDELGITTNGIVLERTLAPLLDAGLTGVNISLDTFDANKFMIMTRRQGLDRVLRAIRACVATGRFDPVKINCVVMRGVNDDEIPLFLDLIRDDNVEVRFIEFMPFDDNLWNRKKMMSFMEIMDVVESHTKSKLFHVKNSETAKLFGVDGHRGRLGFITSMTDHFCGTCNRLRLTAEGNLKVCLFGEDEVPLRDLLRANPSDDSAVVSAIGAAVKAKMFSHGGKGSPEQIAAGKNRPMTSIGG